MRLQSRAKDASHGSAWEVLPAMELLLDHLEDAKLTYQDVSVEINPTILPPPAHLTRRQRQPRQPPPSPVNDDLNDASRRHLRTAINNAWEKLDRYYASTEESPVYVASLVLHPGQKWRYFEAKWGVSHNDWLVDARTKVSAFYEEHWQNCRNTDTGTVEATIEAPRCEPDELEAWITPHDYYTTESTTVDDYDAYLASPAIPVDNPIIWWRDHQTNYPRLSQMAFDLLSVPAMSAECERVFSQAKLTISSQRHSLTDITINAIQCLKNWVRNDAFSLA